jgi:hypothetical protein
MRRLALLVILVLLSCKNEKRAMQADSGNSLGRTAPTSSNALAVTATEQTSTAPAQAPKSPGRMIIRNANLSLVVRDAAEVLKRSTAFVESKGGYVAEEKQWKESQQVRASAVMRVPSTQLAAALAALSSFAVRVESESITGQDVSQEFSDLGAQLKNLQATEIELRELLKTVRQRTQKASEVMEVFNEISKVRGEIERIQGRMQYLSQMTALSTITLELVPDALAAPVVEPGWQPVATIREAARSLINTLKTLADARFVRDAAVAPALEAIARTTRDVQQAVAIVSADRSARPPYKLLSAP